MENYTFPMNAADVLRSRLVRKKNENTVRIRQLKRMRITVEHAAQDADKRFGLLPSPISKGSTPHPKVARMLNHPEFIPPPKGGLVRHARRKDIHTEADLLTAQKRQRLFDDRRSIWERGLKGHMSERDDEFRVKEEP